MLGCRNNCRYCPTRQRALEVHLKPTAMLNWNDRGEIDWRCMSVLEAHVTGSKITDLAGIERVIVPRGHDLFPEHLPVIKQVLKNILELDPPVKQLIVTSKPRSEVIADLMDFLEPWKERVLWRFAINSLDPEVSAYWEPGAPTPHERIKALKLAFERGFNTSVYIEPFLDYDPGDLINSIHDYVTHTISLGLMRVVLNDQMYQRNYNYDHLKDLYIRYGGIKAMRFRHSYLNRLKELIPGGEMARPELVAAIETLQKAQREKIEVPAEWQAAHEKLVALLQEG
jgi:hypothetical protein